MKVIGKMMNLKEKEYYIDGDKYEGDFKNDVRDGKGIMYCYNGDKFEGEWKNDDFVENDLFL